MQQDPDRERCRWGRGCGEWTDLYILPEAIGSHGRSSGATSLVYICDTHSGAVCGEQPGVAGLQLPFGPAAPENLWASDPRDGAQ